ncbi:DUF4142 domain-containing protein [Streptomyces sp. H10-C2]|uniref:DUF4142 domain-containing protein n=1 Tax=unclassified Streptomyces TaxID=2593676 RepID=UPI0024BA0171|nr:MULTISPECIES: DUF4142 domain-containing protein [unclassified Streptomyces]MDJ0340953.1 DUF4142 domain-containing protein [Streptomyces sp. PH10-H1]MDJ0369815.1 DUF4142 domain-containing protein [Streptomyces sp. H10-C2]
MRSFVPRSVLSASVGSRFTVGTALVIGALAVTLVALLIPMQKFGGQSSAAVAGPIADDGGGTVNTPSGPLTPIDREFIRKVRLAGLWEFPAGQQAQQRGTQESVRIAGTHLIEGHTELDMRVNAVGKALGVDLPSQPSKEQQGWLSQLDGAQGADYDRLFVNLLRRAHGKVFALVAQVRGQTRNTMVRSLATRANAVVLDHISVLEDTGLVDFGALADGSTPSSGKPVVIITASASTPERRSEVK